MPLCQTQTPKQQKSFKAFNIVLAISDERYAEFQIETDKDPELQAVMTSIRNGWSDTRAKTPVEASPYWTFRDEMATTDGLIFKGTRIVVLQKLRPDVLQQIHKSHLGISKCQQKAREILYWPSMSADIKHMILNCNKCAEQAKKEPPEPLRPTKPSASALLTTCHQLFLGAE